MAAITGTFTATDFSAVLIPKRTIPGEPASFNVSIQGTFTATVLLERSFDGSTFETCSKPDLSAASFTAPVSFLAEEPEPNVQYRLRCSAFTSGTVTYRLSQ